MRTELPVVVIGAGPVGLAAAAHLVERGIEPVVFEQGSSAASGVQEWGHVRLFSPWSELVDAAAARLLEPSGWHAPDSTRYPTGAQWVSQYLAPLAAQLGGRIRYKSRISGISRQGRDRVVDTGRDDQPYSVHVTDTDREHTVLARAVIDASGTWATPNPLGADGYPAAGEELSGDQIGYRMPDITAAAERARYAGKHTAVVGSGHSAMTALLALIDLAAGEPDTNLTWVLRRGVDGNTYGGGTADQLPARGVLGQRVKAAVEQGMIEMVTGFRTTSVKPASGGRLTMVADDERTVPDVDQVLALTGFRPDLGFLSEVRLGLDHRLSAPERLAPLIDPNVHSCGSVPPHGVKELSHPDADLYLVGMKSYGRAPTFLAMTGYEQVRSVVAAVSGDRASAERVELSLPETGVCGGAGLYDDADAAGGCCEPNTEILQIEVSPREMV